MKPRPIRVGVFDQIVSGGGVRFFTLKLLEEFSRLSNSEWRFRLMWPLFDSSNKFLPRPRFKNVGFERINLEEQSAVHNRILPALHGIYGKLKVIKDYQRLATRVEGYEMKVRNEEQRKLRAGNGCGLKWLDERTDAFDLIYLPYPYLTLPGAGDWRPRKPLVITVHDLAHEHTDAWGELTEPLCREVRRWTQLADLVIFSSDTVKIEAQRIYGLPEERIKRIYLAPAKLEKGASNCNLPRRLGINKRYILTLGWAARHKRVETIIEGFALFKKRFGDDVALVIAGPDTDKLKKGGTCGLEIGKDLFALGYVSDEDIPGLYEGAEAIVTASISEAGLNAMIFDAMNLERPVICSRIPQFVERLGADDSLALMFDPLSPEELAEALARHFGDLGSARQRVANAKKFIDSRRLPDVARDYLAAFRSVLSKSCDDISG